jgi:asparagine synthase (glutamine-hydrolysing)
VCGICGKLSWGEPPLSDLIERMNSKIAHRGPDADGIWISGPVALGHRRLSIIDLSPAGKQPMLDSSGRYCISFNGEIYNYLALRDELTQMGAHFRSRTDTEVILEAYKHWGVECLRRLNGMFAFALWDEANQRLFMARDRLGKKPLFYQMLPDGGVVFASELKSLVEDPVVSRRMNPRAVGQYLSLNYTLTNECILTGVKKLPAGHSLVIERGRSPQESSYWDLANHFRDKRRFASDEEAAEALRSLIDDATRLRLVSDVPLGAFLSGGVDSSTLVASMCQARSPQDVHSFSVGFREKSFSELEEAREVANLLGITHRDEVVLPDAAELLPKMVYYADEPFADSSMIPMYLLAGFSRRHVTVCLSGDGGDEIFAGYETYVADKIHDLTRWVPGWGSRILHSMVDRFWPVSYDKVSLDYKLRQFLEGHAYSPMRAHYHWRSIFSDEEKQRWLRPEVRRAVLECDPFDGFLEHQRAVADLHYLDQAMYVDIKTWLVDDILVKVDRSTMAHALEARAPLLDHRVVEFAASLPVDLKLRGFDKKYLLKKSQSARIPNRILRRKKQGFSAPISHWLMSSLGEQYREITTSPEQPILDPGYVERLWMEHEKSVQDHSLKLLGLINLCLWQRQYRAEMSV